MLRSFIDFFRPPVFEGDDEKTRIARLASRTLLFAWILIPLVLVSSFILKSPPQFLIPLAIGLAIVIFALTFALQKGYVQASSIGIVAVLLLATIYVNYFGGGELRPVIVLYGWLIVVAGLLLGGRGAIITALLVGLQEGILAWLGSSGRIHPILPAATPLNGFVVSFTALLLIAFTYSLAAGSIQNALNKIRTSEKSLEKSNQELQDLTQTLEQRVQERTTELTQSNETSQQRAYELQIVADVARAVASLRNLDELLPEITHIISERFRYYHVGIFLLDNDRQYAVLRAANSEGGQRMLARGHKLRVEPTSIVGYASAYVRPRVASDVGTDAVYFSNPDLPTTHSEMALPLIVGDQLIGVLDIQSIEAGAFGEEQIEVLTTLANQVAVAIENARLFGQTQQALEEAQKIYNEFVAQGWRQNSKTRTTLGYRFDKGKISSLTSPIEVRAMTAVKDSNEGEMTLPIQIRNQVIGVLNIRPGDGSRRWSENDLVIVRAAVERAGLALENARLLDDAQRRSARERSIGEISNKISTLSDIDSIMRSAVEELGHRLGSSTEVTLELGNGSQE
ncbi:MAG: GAF domain-containing protein [Anaerolineales bacterium]